MSIFEAVMLICFGAAWPVAILKSWHSKSVQGKSLGFLLIVVVGYLAGILHKIFYDPDWVMLLYIINLFMVVLDVFLYLRNCKNGTCHK